MNHIRTEIRDLRRNSSIAYVSSVREDGTPQIKAMLVLEHDHLDTQYFSTNLRLKRTQQFLKNPLASVYYCDAAGFKAALFSGTMEVCTDRDTKSYMWRDGGEIYYPEGIDDPDYCVLKFTAQSVNYYHNLKNRTLPIEDIK